MRRKAVFCGGAAVAVALAAVLVAISSASSSAPTVLVSAAAAGGSGNGDSWLGGSARQIDGGGHYVVFTSTADDLTAVPDTNGLADVYLRDVQTSVTTRVTFAADGSEPDGSSYSPSVSADGRYIAFASDATNLVPGDTNAVTDVFVRDIVAGVTTRVSIPTVGGEGDGGSYSPSISSDGSRVAFATDATNLVTDDTNFLTDIFVRDLVAVTTSRVSVAAVGGDSDGPSSSPAISGDGQVVAFASDASNLAGDDFNFATDIFATTLATGATIRMSVAADGTDADGPSYSPAISHTGRYVAFMSVASNLIVDDTNFAFDVFRRDVTTGTTARFSFSTAGGDANGSAYSPSISDDGTRVAFISDSTNLVPGDGNFLFDVFTSDGTAVSRASVSSAGVDLDGPSYVPVLSDDGSRVAFLSYATNLIDGAANGFGQVYMADAVPPVTLLVPAISADVAGLLKLPVMTLGDPFPSAPVTITNTGTADLHVNALAVFGRALSVEPACAPPLTLGPGASCTITVDFRPVLVGPVWGALTISSDASSGPFVIPVTANALQPQAAGGGYILLPGAPSPKAKTIEQFRERFAFAFRMPRDGVVKGKQLTYRYYSGGSFWVVRTLSATRLTVGVDGTGCPTAAFGGPAEVRRIVGSSEQPPEPGTFWATVALTDCGSVPSSSPQSGVGFDSLSIAVLDGGPAGSPVHVTGATPGILNPIAYGSIGVSAVDLTPFVTPPPPATTSGP